MVNLYPFQVRAERESGERPHATWSDDLMLQIGASLSSSTSVAGAADKSRCACLLQATVAKGADFDNCVENIDIGGPAMIRGGWESWLMNH